jgi:hypothetical protein
MPAKKSVKKSGAKSGALVRQPHGGAIRRGSEKGNTPGSGRPPDAIRAAMRDLGATKGLPFLETVLDGTVAVRFIGTCEHCGETSDIDLAWMKEVEQLAKASVDHRIKASDLTMKYGLSTKELVIASTEAAAFFDCVYRATVEQVGEVAAQAIKLRAVVLMDGKA